MSTASIPVSSGKETWLESKITGTTEMLPWLQEEVDKTPTPGESLIKPGSFGW